MQTSETNCVGQFHNVLSGVFIIATYKNIALDLVLEVHQMVSGPDPVNVTRANLTMFITFLSIAGLAMFYTTGAITVPLASSAALLIIPFFIATWTGTKLFPILSEVVVRRIGIVAMLCIGIATLFR